MTATTPRSSARTVMPLPLEASSSGAAIAETTDTEAFCKVKSVPSTNCVPWEFEKLQAQSALRSKSEVPGLVATNVKVAMSNVPVGAVLRKAPKSILVAPDALAAQFPPESQFPKGTSKTDVLI